MPNLTSTPALNSTVIPVVNPIIKPIVIPVVSPIVSTPAKKICNDANSTDTCTASYYAHIPLAFIDCYDTEGALLSRQETYYSTPLI